MHACSGASGYSERNACARLGRCITCSNRTSALQPPTRTRARTSPGGRIASDFAVLSSTFPSRSACIGSSALATDSTLAPETASAATFCAAARASRGEQSREYRSDQRGFVRNMVRFCRCFCSSTRCWLCRPTWRSAISTCRTWRTTITAGGRAYERFATAVLPPSGSRAAAKRRGENCGLERPPTWQHAKQGVAHLLGNEIDPKTIAISTPLRDHAWLAP